MARRRADTDLVPTVVPLSVKVGFELLNDNKLRQHLSLIIFVPDDNASVSRASHQFVGLRVPVHGVDVAVVLKCDQTRLHLLL